MQIRDVLVVVVVDVAQASQHIQTVIYFPDLIFS